MGLIGQLTIQLLKANGCRVIGIDFDYAKCQLGQQTSRDGMPFQRVDALHSANSLTNGRGVDGVLITASTDSSDPVTCRKNVRKRGRIILVGVVGLI